jgi:hypothetical protein
MPALTALFNEPARAWTLPELAQRTPTMISGPPPYQPLMAAEPRRMAAERPPALARVPRPARALRPGRPVAAGRLAASSAAAVAATAPVALASAVVAAAPAALACLDLLSKLVDLLLVLLLQGLHLLPVLLLHYLHLLLELVDQAVELGGTLRRRRMHDEQRDGDQRTAPQSPPQDCHSSSYGLRRGATGEPSLSHYAG